MANIGQYLAELDRLRDMLADILVNMGEEASREEPLQTLIPKLKELGGFTELFSGTLVSPEPSYGYYCFGELVYLDGIVTVAQVYKMDTATITIDVTDGDAGCVAVAAPGWEVTQSGTAYILTANVQGMLNADVSSLVGPVAIQATESCEITLSAHMTGRSGAQHDAVGQAEVLFRGTSWEVIEAHGMTWEMIEAEGMTWEELQNVPKP